MLEKRRKDTVYLKLVFLVFFWKNINMNDNKLFLFIGYNTQLNIKFKPISFIFFYF